MAIFVIFLIIAILLIVPVIVYIFDAIITRMTRMEDKPSSWLDNEKKSQPLDIDALVKKYKRLSPEEILFTDFNSIEVDFNSIEVIMPPLMKQNLTARHKKEGMERDDYIKAILLYKICGFTTKEIEELFKSTERAKTEAKLRTTKRKIYEKALEMHGVINEGREPIPEQVQSKVWNRDSGKCVKCGSREKLEFDHIIPVSKGGSNTARNIQLLCEKCNREKHDNVG